MKEFRDICNNRDTFYFQHQVNKKGNDANRDVEKL